MTQTIEVHPKQDFWYRLCRTRPLRAISEIVWNALDADAEIVAVDFHLNPLGGLQEIIISDDGTGIPIPIGEEHQFSALGGSWKATVGRTKRKRLMHGKFGEGRFRAFALGGFVSWDTAFREDDTLVGYQISGSTGSPGKFILSDRIASSRKKSGTIVSITNPEPNEAILLSTDFRENLARVFAPYLLNYRDVELRIQNVRLDTDDIVAIKTYLHSIQSNRIVVRSLKHR